MSKPLDEINTSSNKTDLMVSALKGSLGAIPVVGSLAAEVIGTLIPNQRIDRINEYLHILGEKVASIEAAILEDKFHDEGFIDLFEDSLYQAARALTRERKENIASLVKNSITDEKAEYLRYKYLLSLLSELNDVEILLLQSYVRHNDEEFHDKHEDVLWKPLISDDWDVRTIHENYKEHLVRLGLLRYRFKKPKKGEFPEFDEKTGAMKSQGHDITSLGRILLRHVDLAEKI